MSNSFFDNKTPESYCASIISFDDDYYYGQFYRRYEDGFKQFLCNFKLDLDESALITVENTDFIDRQICNDFEVDLNQTRNDRILSLLETFENEICKSSDLIFKVLKSDGGTVHLIIK